MLEHSPVPLEAIRAAQARLAGKIIRTPLVRLNVDEAPADIYLKLENLQPIGAFKLRGAGNAIALASPADLARGVYTSSAGNMAQGVAWHARQLGLSCSIVVPDHAPQTKLDAIRRLGADYIKVPFDEWWQIVIDHGYGPLSDRHFIHPSSDRGVMAGNGTIALEIMEDLPDVDALIIPYGSGGLSSGIASAMRALKPQAKIYVCEVETGAPVAATLSAGERTEVPYTASFVDGIGAASLLPEMWPLIQALIDDALVVTVDAIAAAVRLLVERNRVVAEGAGAAPVAAAMAGIAEGQNIVCIVSGGNIDTRVLAKILEGEI